MNYKGVYMVNKAGVGIWHNPGSEKLLKKDGWKRETPPKTKEEQEADAKKELAAKEKAVKAGAKAAAAKSDEK